MSRENFNTKKNTNRVRRNRGVVGRKPQPSPVVPPSDSAKLASILNWDRYLQDTDYPTPNGFWTWLCCKAIAVVTDPQASGMCGDCHAEGVYGGGGGGGMNPSPYSSNMGNMGGSDNVNFINCCGTVWENALCCPGSLPGLPIRDQGGQMPPGVIGRVQEYSISKNPAVAATEIQSIAQQSGERVSYDEIYGKMTYYKQMNDDGQNIQPQNFLTCNGCGNSKPGLCLWNGQNSSGCMNGIIKISVKFK